MKRQFEVEFPTDLGLMWINADNLTMCLKTEVHIAEDLAKAVTVTDITDDVVEFQPGDHVVRYPSQLEFMELHLRLDRVQSPEETHAIVEEWLHEYVFTDDEVEFNGEELELTTFYGVPLLMLRSDMYNEQYDGPVFFLEDDCCSVILNDVPRSDSSVLAKNWSDGQEYAYTIGSFAKAFNEAARDEMGDLWIVQLVVDQCYDLHYISNLMAYRSSFYEWLDSLKYVTDLMEWCSGFYGCVDRIPTREDG